MSTAAITPVRESLWKIEDDLDALLNTVDMVETEEQRQELKAAIAETLEKAASKRDQVAAWLAREESTIAAVDAEIERLKKLKEKRCRLIEKVEEYVIGLILTRGTDSKGRFARLEGNTSRLCVKKNPPAIEITDASIVPERFETVTLQFSPEDWTSFTDDLDFEHYSKLEEHVKDCSPDKQAIKRALGAGETVPGARFAPIKYRLERE